MLIINILLPIFILILFGYFLKKIKFPHEDFWKHIDRFNYYILFPSLLIYKLSTANIKNIQNFDLIIVATLTILILSILLIIYNKLFALDNSSFTSLYQGSIRFNTYVFLALVDGLFKDTGIVIAALLIAFMIPLLNLLSISAFSYYIPNSKVTFYSFFKSIFSNPLILACIFGASLNILGLNLPNILLNTLSILSLAALPLGLLSVGVGLHLSNISSTKLELFISSIVKLIIFPLLIFLMAKLFNLDSTYTSILVIFGAVPTATSAYILAKELGGDVKLISSIISIQTIFSIITISIFLQFI